MLFWLCARRGRRRRSSGRRATAVQNTLYAVVGLQRPMLVCASLASARRLFQGTRVNRSMWVEHRSTAFFKISFLVGVITTSVVQHFAKRCLTCVNAINSRIHRIMRISRLFRIYKWRQLRFGLETRRARTSFSRGKLCIGISTLYCTKTHARKVKPFAWIEVTRSKRYLHSNLFFILIILSQCENIDYWSRY